MHDPVRVPETVGAGTAKVVVSFEDWKEGKVAASEGRLSIVAPPRDATLEATSPRLRQTLIHPDKSGVLLGLRYTRNGRRIVAGHHVSGIVQIWDAISGRQLRSIGTSPLTKAYPYRDFLYLSPDGKLLYANRGTTSTRSVKKDGKRLGRWEFTGDVRAWDMATGELRLTIRHPPPSGIYFMILSPDGSTLVTFECDSGDFEKFPKTSSVLWDAKTGQRLRKLPEARMAAFSPDSKTLVMDEDDDNYETKALRFIDVATGNVRLSVPSKGDRIRSSYRVFSPDGKLLAGTLRHVETGKSQLLLWSAATGSEVASFPMQKTAFYPPLFSPDGRRLILANWGVGPREIVLIDVAKRRIVKTPNFGERGSLRQPVFSPDGKWIAAIYQEVPELVSAAKMQDVALLPQPHIHLIEAATGELRETLVAPPGVAASLCFSPDGKTLASGGDGRVLLWDLTKPPGALTDKRAK